MTAQANKTPQRRGACPGLSAPMRTGDGLLVRLLPRGTISVRAFAALAEAARAHGNGVLEITSRGSIQVRGLSETSAPKFADAIGALDIAADDGVPVLCNPLAGLDAEEIFDSTSLAEDLRRRIAQSRLAAQLSPKVSVAIDGGGAIGLDAIAADIRLRAKKTSSEVVFEVGAGGDDARACKFGLLEPALGVETVIRLLEIVARHGREARARDILAAEGEAVFRSAIDNLLLSACGPRLGRTERNAPLGTFVLREEKVATGIGLAFGHANADALERLIEAAETSGAAGLRMAPGRALLAVGLTTDRAPAFAAQAERLGFITRADDPRRRVIACAGAPICASAHIASRTLAPLIAADAATQFTGTIHVSGCGKGCAHAGRAALTVVGTSEGCTLIANGSARDAPIAVVPENKLRAAITDHVREHSRETAHV
jgi:precorrin-3B synthase